MLQQGDANKQMAVLEMGFTTIGDGGGRGLVGPAIRDAVAQGVVPGPRMVAAGQILCGTAGLLDSTALYQPYQPGLDDPRLPQLIKEFNA